MKTIDKAIKDWKVISNKVTNLRNTGHLELTKKYLIRDVAQCMKNYKQNYGIIYDPLVPPNQRTLDNIY